MRSSNNSNTRWKKSKGNPLWQTHSNAHTSRYANKKFNTLLKIDLEGNTCACPIEVGVALSYTPNMARREKCIDTERKVAICIVYLYYVLYMLWIVVMLLYRYKYIVLNNIQKQCIWHCILWCNIYEENTRINVDMNIVWLNDGNWKWLLEWAILSECRWVMMLLFTIIDTPTIL